MHVAGFIFVAALISVPAIVFFPAYSIYFFAARYPHCTQCSIRRRLSLRFLRMHLSRRNFIQWRSSKSTRKPGSLMDYLAN